MHMLEHCCILEIRRNSVMSLPALKLGEERARHFVLTELFACNASQLIPLHIMVRVPNNTRRSMKRIFWFTLLYDIVRPQHGDLRHFYVSSLACNSFKIEALFSSSIETLYWLSNFVDFRTFYRL